MTAALLQPVAGPRRGWAPVVLPGGAGAPVTGFEERTSGLTAARRAAGLSVTELARALHVSRPTVSMWERGVRGVARHYWPALGAALALDLDAVAGLFAGQPPARLDGVRLPSLQLARRASGLTQQGLAERLGVAPTTLSMWESGGVRVPALTVAELVRILGVDVEALSENPPAPGPDDRPLRALRRAAGMTWREAAAHLDISVGTLARYESGERSTPVAVLRKMSAVYRRPPRELLCFSGAVVPLPASCPWQPEDVPQAIQALRTAVGLSKADLGRMLGRSGQAVRAWETGRTRPAEATCRRLEAVFGLPAGTLPH
jgi:transcriptional regulator with XRE-family HTH domain